MYKFENGRSLATANRRAGVYGSTRADAVDANVAIASSIITYGSKLIHGLGTTRGLAIDARYARRRR